MKNLDIWLTFTGLAFTTVPTSKSFRIVGSALISSDVESSYGRKYPLFSIEMIEKKKGSKRDREKEQRQDGLKKIGGVNYEAVADRQVKP